MNKKFSAYLPEAYLGIAHRGLHNKDFTENGLKAFQNAIEHHLAFELDIHLTKDGELVVCHDSELKRTTGKEGIIEDLTLKEIKDSYRLLDGEEVPTFQEVLDLNKEQSVIVTELKSYKGNYRPLAKAAKKILKQIKNPKKIVMISFDPRALLLMGHRYQRQLLICADHDWTWKLRHFYDSVDIDQVMLERPSVQKYRKHGNIVNAWTITSPEALEKVSKLADQITFQDFDYEIVVEDRKHYLDAHK